MADDVIYPPLCVDEVMNDTTQRRSTYLNIKKFINSELKECDLAGKRLAVLEAVLACTEIGVRDPTQRHVFQVDRIREFSHDRLCVLLANILTAAGENYLDDGPYANLVRETFAAVLPETRESSRERDLETKERELQMLRELVALRASVERATSPPPRRPKSKAKPRAPQPPQPQRAEDTDDSDSIEITEDTDTSDVMEADADEVTIFSEAKFYPFTEPKLLTQKFSDLKDYIFDAHGEAVLENKFVQNCLKQIGTEVRAAKNGGIVVGPRRVNNFQQLLNKLFASIYHALGVADYRTTMKNFLKLDLAKSNVGKAIKNSAPPKDKPYTATSNFTQNTFKPRPPNPANPPTYQQSGAKCSRCGRTGHEAKNCYARTSKNFSQ